MKHIAFVGVGLLLFAAGVTVGTTPIIEHASPTDVLLVRGIAVLAIAIGLMAMSRPILLTHRLR